VFGCSYLAAERKKKRQDFRKKKVEKKRRVIIDSGEGLKTSGSEREYILIESVCESVL